MLSVVISLILLLYTLSSKMSNFLYSSFEMQGLLLVIFQWEESAFLFLDVLFLMCRVPAITVIPS